MDNDSFGFAVIVVWVVIFGVALFSGLLFFGLRALLRKIFGRQ